jgi:hypothetical protein
MGLEFFNRHGVKVYVMVSDGIKQPNMNGEMYLSILKTHYIGVKRSNKRNERK